LQVSPVVFNLPSAPLSFSVPRRRRRSSISGRCSTAPLPLLTSRRRSSPALRPSPPPCPLLALPRVCRRRPSHYVADLSTPPWSSALRPSRTSSSLYIAALGRVEASSHPLAPLSLAGALLPVPPRRRPTASRWRPPSRPPQARSRPQTGVSQCPLTPHPLPLAIRALPSPDLGLDRACPGRPWQKGLFAKFQLFPRV
jgi:hypothetical protein